MWFVVISFNAQFYFLHMEPNLCLSLNFRKKCAVNDEHSQDILFFNLNSAIKYKNIFYCGKGRWSGGCRRINKSSSHCVEKQIDSKSKLTFDVVKAQLKYRNK